MFPHPHSNIHQPHPNINQPPPPTPSPINCNDDTMEMAFLVQMRQSNYCGTVRNEDYISYFYMTHYNRILSQDIQMSLLT